MDAFLSALGDPVIDPEEGIVTNIKPWNSRLALYLAMGSS
jgi:hypothetical protein